MKRAGAIIPRRGARTRKQKTEKEIKKEMEKKKRGQGNVGRTNERERDQVREDKTPKGGIHH
jgi:hypothetical protein